MQFSKDFLQDIESWDYTQPNVMEVRMEDLTQKPELVFSEIFQFLGILDGYTSSLIYPCKLSLMMLNKVNRKWRRFTPFHLPVYPFKYPLRKLPHQKLNAILHKFRFEKLAGGRKRGEEDIHNHYRKGMPGDWKNHFTEEHNDFFNREFDGLLLKLGYK